MGQEHRFSEVSRKRKELQHDSDSPDFARANDGWLQGTRTGPKAIHLPQDRKSLRLPIERARRNL